MPVPLCILLPGNNARRQIHESVSRSVQIEPPADPDSGASQFRRTIISVTSAVSFEKSQHKIAELNDVSFVDRIPINTHLIVN